MSTQYYDMIPFIIVAILKTHPLTTCLQYIYILFCFKYNTIHTCMAAICNTDLFKQAYTDKLPREMAISKRYALHHKKKNYISTNLLYILDAVDSCT